MYNLSTFKKSDVIRVNRKCVGGSNFWPDSYIKNLTAEKNQNLTSTLAAWPLRGHTALKSILWETLFLDLPHDFSLLSLNYFLHQFLKPKFMWKNSLTPRKFHFRRPIFINQNDTLFSKKSNSSIKTILWRKSFETYFDIPKLFWNFQFRYVWRICSWNLFNCIH